MLSAETAAANDGQAALDDLFLLGADRPDRTGYALSFSGGAGFGMDGFFRSGINVSSETHLEMILQKWVFCCE
jgi:hypothetical protein